MDHGKQQRIQKARARDLIVSLEALTRNAISDDPVGVVDLGKRSVGSSSPAVSCADLLARRRTQHPGRGAIGRRYARQYPIYLGHADLNVGLFPPVLPGPYSGCRVYRDTLNRRSIDENE
jgi:hypothetical protein